MTAPTIKPVSPAEALNPGPAPQGNNEVARKIHREVIRVITKHAKGAKRSQQVHIGPSELGAACDRKIVAKLIAPHLGLPPSAPSDPWPSIVGTAIHAWLAEAFEADNPKRWMVEHRVTPHPEHPGTADLYDGELFVAGDHKNLGATPMVKLKAQGPSREYKVQLALYGLGLMRQGYRVDHVAIIAYPRTGSSLDGVYVWSEPMDEKMAELISEVFEDTRRRKIYAQEILDGKRIANPGGHVLDTVPATSGSCYFCQLKDFCPDSR